MMIKRRHLTIRVHAHYLCLPMPRPQYFESQVDHFCTIHAVNNALQRQQLTASAMRRTAREMATESARSVRQQQQASGRKVEALQVLKQRFLSNWMTPLGDFSPDVAIRLLRQQKLYTVYGKTASFPMRGTFWLTGESTSEFDPDSSYAHSVAIRDGWWLDSEQDGPIKLRAGEPLPSNFRLWAVYRVTRTRPRAPAAAADDVVDLTGDEE